MSLLINNNKQMIKLIESSVDGNLRIWNFNSGLLLNKIKICDKSIKGICLWNSNYLFVGCPDKTIKLVEIEKGLILDSLTTHTDQVITVKKIFQPKFGECLFSQNWHESTIKIWVIKNDYLKNKTN